MILLFQLILVLVSAVRSPQHVVFNLTGDNFLRFIQLTVKNHGMISSTILNDLK